MKRIMANLKGNTKLLIQPSLPSPWEVSKAKKEHRRLYPACAACGGPKAEAHHIKPVSWYPEKAADADNLLSLCRKQGCHLRIGHGGTYSNYIPNVKDTAHGVRGKLDQRIILRKGVDL